MALPVESRARALLTLPQEGELAPTPGEAAHLAQVRPVLLFHDRLDAISIKIIHLPQAKVGCYARSILLVSRRAVSLLSVAELEGVIAHEMGHDFFWDEYYDARARHDRAALQAIELKCDGIAALTMRGVRHRALTPTVDCRACSIGVRRSNWQSRAHQNTREQLQLVFWLQPRITAH